MKRIAMALTALALTACASAPKPETPITVQKADVVVAANCVPAGKLNLDPSFPDTADVLKGLPSAAERYQEIAAGRILRDQWIKEALPVLKACAAE